MARMARLIIYDADDLSLTKQLAGSLSEGLHEKGKVSIMIINLAADPLLNGIVQDLTKKQDD